MVRVLITESQYKHSLGAARAVSRAGFEVHTFGKRAGQASISRVTASSTLFNPSGSTSFADDVLLTVALKDIDVLLPIGSESVVAVQEHRDLFSRKVRFALAPNESLALALDKSRTLEAARALGIECPETWIFPTFELLRAQISKIKLPFVIKSASELAKFGPHYLYSARDVENLLLRFDLRESLLETSMIVQEIIRGPGIGFFALYQEGSCKRLFMHQRIRETPSSGGSSWAAKGIDNPELSAAGLKLLDSFNWHGPAMVEFKLNETSSRPSLMELNPKFWGSLDLAIESGVDFPSDTVRVALGETLEANFNYDAGQFFVWPLEEPHRYFGDRELHDKKYRTNIELSDAAPALYQALQKLVLSIAKRSIFLSNLLYWASHYDLKGMRGRFVGQILGIPTRPHCRISDDLWVGAQPNWLGELLLKARGFTVRASLIEDNLSSKYSPLKLLRIPLEEFAALPTPKLWEYTDLLLLELKGRGNRVFVHCREGVGRAPAVAAALLMRQGQTLSEALDRVQDGRRVAGINKLQLSSLEKFSKEISSKRR